MKSRRPVNSTVGLHLMLKRIVMSLPGRILVTMLLVSALAAATALVKHLSHGTIPPRLEPIAAWWVNAGYDPNRFRSLLWLCFWSLAIIFFAAVGYALYLGATGLSGNF
jgi:hypothetical protein